MSNLTTEGFVSKNLKANHPIKDYPALKNPTADHLETENLLVQNFSLELDQTYVQLRLGLAKNLRDYHWRIEQLRALKRMIEENDEALNQAMWQDLRKSPFECAASEQGVVLGEINLTLKKLKKWMKAKRVATPLFNQLGRSQIVYEPYGLVLIIGAWNYPINLTLTPLVAAIAGGNAAIIKPSEIAVHTGELIAKLIPRYLDPSLVAVIQGGVEQTNLLLDKKFDKIFFTGSGPVGKIILQKAAVHLTPVTLELGGKSPAIVMPDADLIVTARRLVWGKFLNAGQTCVAPDYLIVHPEIRERLVLELKKSLANFFGPDIIKSPDYCRIINAKNFDRLTKLMQGLPLLHGGKCQRDELFIEPTILLARPEMEIMQEEIFGPILPILEMKDVNQMIEFINSRPRPLSLYVFTKNHQTIKAFTGRTSSGALCINDVVIHMPIATLPFGGVGESGMGNYHGEYSFKTFTHAKGVLNKSFWFDIPIRYAPYTKGKARLLRWMMS
jgi:aldehyde dehydrogenase (NAD+)